MDSCASLICMQYLQLLHDLYMPFSPFFVIFQFLYILTLSRPIATLVAMHIIGLKWAKDEHFTSISLAMMYLIVNNIQLTKCLKF